MAEIPHGHGRRQDLTQHRGHCRAHHAPAQAENENGVQKIWMEEAKSLGLKKDLVNQYDLAGIACWKLGFETADIWTIMDEVK